MVVDCIEKWKNEKYLQVEFVKNHLWYNHFEFDLSESIPHLLRLSSNYRFRRKKKFEASQKGEKKKNNEIDLSTECDHAEYRKKS